MKKVMLIMAAALLMMTQCKKENETPTDPAEGTVKMTVTAGPGRTDISTETGAITWSTGDKLYVSDGTNWLGSLTLVGEGGSAQGTFTGSIAGIGDGTTPCHFFYLGHDNGMTEPTGSTAACISFAEQDGTLASAMKYHLGYGNTSVTVSEGEATGSVIMNTKIAIAHINFTDGTSAYTGSLTMGGTGISNTLSVSPDGTFSGSGTDGITIGNGDGESGERYVTLIPTTGTDRVDVAFTGDAAGSMTFLAGIHENKFYGMKDAIAVTTHEYVDLGLPSGLLWATCNLGAEHPYDYGNYYAWGETAGYREKMDGEGANAGASYSPGTVKTNYGWAYYKWGSGDNNLGKYVNETNYGMATPDNLTTLLSEDDAATKNWGSDWRMPTEAEFTELINNTTQTWYAEGNTEFNGFAGYKCVSTKAGYTDKYIFLPAAGFRNGTDVCYELSVGCYWSSSLHSFDPSRAYFMFFNLEGVNQKDSFYRYCGFAVRPVCVLLGSS